MRIGFGYDVHKLVEGRRLILGGIDIPFELGLLGHSDADVVTHAIMDSILGALALGDIGKHFPDNDNSFEGADSLLLLQKVVGLIDEKGYKVNNIDATIIAQKPKIAPYIDNIAINIAKVCNVPVHYVSVKATTEEHLGFTGRMEGIKATAVCTLVQK